ncbi:MAG: trypsin-like peptidase domain-containing protein [Armatimonadetes bacterium]|nr:trypsin-like peptidase domain-containing protein [Armatimonadota bacterium]
MSVTCIPIRAWRIAIISAALSLSPQLLMADQNSIGGLKDLQNTFVSIAQRLEPVVVTVISERVIRAHFFGRSGQGGQTGPDFTPNFLRTEGTGSGIIIRADGWILTNDHVVDGADRVIVKLRDGREFDGTWYGDFRSDLAVIHIPATNLPVATLGDSSRVRIGQWALAIGSPFQFAGTVSVGVISSMHRREEIPDEQRGMYRLYPDLIQTDAAINPGNSGGPLVDISGKVIGLNTAIRTESGGSVGIGFAIPINIARYVAGELIENHKVNAGYLGVDPTTVTPPLAAAYHVSYGALVLNEPDPSSPAGKAGLRIEDVVTRYDNLPVTSESGLREAIMETPPGTKVNITYVRNGEARSITATITAAPSGTGGPTETIHTDQPVKLGIGTVPLTSTFARHMRLSPDTTGVMIRHIDPIGAAINSNLRVGDIILRVNGTSIADVDTFQKMADQFKTGDLVRIVYQSYRGSAWITRLALIPMD